MKTRVPYLIIILLLSPLMLNGQSDLLKIIKQSRKVSAQDNSLYNLVNETEYWDPANSAIIICDMWDQHWCKSAEKRVNEMAPFIDHVVKIAGDRGVLIVHSPSDVMDYYEGTPQRELGKKYPDKDLGKLLSGDKLDSEGQARWPIDQSDGGCDGNAEFGQQWPWTRQHEAIEILEGDAITDSGEEIAGLFKEKGITNVILLGVHTNMCIVNRPFGLRNMVRLGKNVVLMRDLTDAMYNPEMDPRVSHFAGTALMIEYIEKYISPTIVSTDFTGERQFRFKGDKNP